MEIVFSEHALERMEERGASSEEVRMAIREGREYPARHGRLRFEQEFQEKQLQVYAVEEEGQWIVVTVICKYY